MEKIIREFIAEKEETEKQVVDNAVAEMLELKKGGTYSELIKEINQCRFHLGNHELLDTLIERITELALSTVIQS